MKKILLSALLLITVVSSYSQDYPPVRLGLKLAPNIGWLNPGTKNYESESVALGATLGFVADLYFAERYAFSTGFNFNFVNGSMNYQSNWYNAGDTLTGTLIRKYNFIYFEVPTMVKMKTKNFGDFSFFGQIGFKTGFRISSKAKDDFSTEAGSAFSEKNAANDQTTLIRESVAVGLGLEYSLDTDSRLFFGVGYDNALNNVLTGTNNLTGTEEKAWLNYVELNLGILF